MPHQPQCCSIKGVKEEAGTTEIREKKLVQDCATRWNSSFYMLEHLMEMRWPVSAVLSDERITKLSERTLDLKSEQWTLGEELMKFLRPFKVATTFFRYEEKTSLSCVLPILNGLLDGLQKETNPPATDSHSPIIQHLKKNVAAEIKQRWELDLPVTSSWVLAPAVDPRFKRLKFLDQAAIETVKSKLVSRMEAFLASNSSDTRASEDEPPEKKQKRAALDILLGPDLNSSIFLLTARDKLKLYMPERPVARRESPLSWWKEDEHRFPNLAKVACGTLCNPATSISSEWIFSIAGLTVTKLHSCLKPSNVDALIF